MSCYAEPVPEGFPQGLPTPEPLSASAAKDASDMIATFGDYTARSFHSKTWQLREAALHRMQQSITPQARQIQHHYRSRFISAVRVFHFVHYYSLAKPDAEKLPPVKVPVTSTRKIYKQDIDIQAT